VPTGEETAQVGGAADEVVAGEVQEAVARERAVCGDAPGARGRGASPECAGGV
jgi:hypothetical protein